MILHHINNYIRYLYIYLLGIYLILNLFINNIKICILKNSEIVLMINIDT